MRTYGRLLDLVLNRPGALCLVHPVWCHAPAPHWTPGSRCDRKAGHGGVHRCDSNGVAWSPDDRPRLVVSSNWPDGDWWYQLVDADGMGRGSAAPTQPAALALGLAALEVAGIGSQVPTGTSDVAAVTDGAQQVPRGSAQVPPFDQSGSAKGRFLHDQR